MRVQILGTGAAVERRPEAKSAPTWGAGRLADAIIDGLAAMQRPSHWILAFLLVLGAVCALSIWIGGPPRGFALQRVPPAQIAPVRTQVPGPPAHAAPLIGEGF